MLMGANRWGYNVYAAVVPAIAGQFAPATPEQIVTALKQLGFHDVLEVAMGADLTAVQEAEELEEKGILSSSCCPAFVSYVEKNFPDQVSLISSTPSPMVTTAKLIQEKDPSARSASIKQHMKNGKHMT